MHNEEWSDEEPKSESEFLNALGEPEINLWEEEAIMIYFPDGGLFSGHCIEVFIEGPERNRAISVGIVG